MTKKVFEITFEVTATVVIENEVFKQVDDEWRSMFYNLKTKEDVARHIAYNLLQGLSIDRLDGFANLPYNFAKLEDESWNCQDVIQIK